MTGVAGTRLTILDTLPVRLAVPAAVVTILVQIVRCQLSNLISVRIFRDGVEKTAPLMQSILFTAKLLAGYQRILNTLDMRLAAPVAVVTTLVRITRRQLVYLIRVCECSVMV